VIQFGFERANSNDSGGPTIKTQHGIDNWSFRLHTQPSPQGANRIAFNNVGVVGGDAGSGFPDTQRNAILGNRIFSNSGLGIDLFGADDSFGVTNNDAGDGDSGPNHLQNFPVITSANANANGTTITGTLNSTPNTNFCIEFFASDAADPSGFGEGQIYLSAITPDVLGATDGSGDVSFTVTLPVAFGAGQVVSATATDSAGNTSEFSARLCGKLQWESDCRRGRSLYHRRGRLAYPGCLRLF
jgi:hypothetical protein